MRTAILALGAVMTTLVAAVPAQAADTALRPGHVITPIAGSSIAAAGSNDHGQVVGVTSVAPDNGQFVPLHGFLWQHGRMTDLGASFQPTAINNKGHILGRVSAPDGTPAGYGLWRDGTVTDLGNLGGSFFVAEALNNRDEIVGEGTLPDFSLRGFVWRAGALTVLPPIPGGFSSMAFDINDSGEIVGASRAADRSHAVKWRNGAVSDLGPAIQTAYLVNDRGQIVGTRDVDATAHALLLSHGTVTDLGGLGTDYTFAHGLNNHTVIVGEGQVVAPQPFHAFKWARGRITDLGEGSAVAINNRDQLVVNRQHPSRVEIFD
jgi:probable HAF family extracellular repeat protein